MPKVTVVMPAYNAGRYIAKAIDSVLAQTLQDWELIIVDDGSTDDTSVVAAHFSDPRIHYLNQENQGPASARNRGLREAHGEYLAFLDADDIWVPEFLDEMVSALSSSRQASYACCGAGFIDDGGALYSKTHYPESSSTSWLDDLVYNRSRLVHTVLCRRDQVNELGGFDTVMFVAEDWDLWLRLEARWGMPVFVHQVLAYYRLLGGSISTNPSRMLQNLIRVVEKHSVYVEDGLRHIIRGRAIASVLLSTAIVYLMQNDYVNATACLEEAAKSDPTFLERDTLYYELLCGNQLKGYRGNVESIDLAKNTFRAKKVLVDIMEHGDSRRSKTSLRHALARLMLTASEMAWQQRNVARSRCMWLTAVWHSPSLVLNPRAVRTGIKSLLGHDMIEAINRLRTRSGSGTRHLAGN